MKAFNEYMPSSNQVDKKREDVRVSASDLLEAPSGEITEQGLRTNISVAVQYIEAWLGGSGAVPIYNLMEDAATAEISRTQVWQWIRHPKGILQDGRKVTLALVEELLEEELQVLLEHLGQERYMDGRYTQAASLFLQLVTEDEFIEFLTIPGYQQLSS